MVVNVAQEVEIGEAAGVEEELIWEGFCQWMLEFVYFRPFIS